MQGCHSLIARRLPGGRGSQTASIKTASTGSFQATVAPKTLVPHRKANVSGLTAAGPL